MGFQAVVAIWRLFFCDVRQSRLLLTAVSGQPMASIWKGQAVKDSYALEDGTARLSWNVDNYQLRCVTSQKNENLMLSGVYKVKCTLIQALRLCTVRTVHRGNRGIALPFLDHGTRRGWGVSVTSQPLFTPRKDPAPIVQEARWAPGPVWTGAENLIPRQDSIPGPSSP